VTAITPQAQGTAVEAATQHHLPRVDQAELTVAAALADSLTVAAAI